MSCLNIQNSRHSYCDHSGRVLQDPGSREKCHHLHHGLLAEMISESKQISHFTSFDKILQDFHERFMKKVLI